ncbi:hypothetical protein [Telmatospirillum siberiense]|uniref:Uncharacterized protein n=1 Tax=Telmatospirillum siberiense TaxID=382514 RepID=A0A2N3PNW0_9PROT|nr:hypothetical protein [Telmatospirillum siberiense]PKU22070.1 hypothetical protein CWS72_23420 [Telmatospirillum siberiense]
MSPLVNGLDRRSVVAAIADYVLQVNYRGYRPDPRKVLSVRRTDRTAWLRNEGIPVRWEVYYYIEGELFPKEGATRLAEGESSVRRAEALVDEVWDQLWAWNGYDFTPTSYGLNKGKYSDEAATSTSDGTQDVVHG